MADKKISALTASSTPLAGTEVLPIVQGGSTVKVSVADLTAGRAVGTAALTASGLATLSVGVVVGDGSFAQSKIYSSAANGLLIIGKTGTTNDLLIAAPGGNSAITIPTGTEDVKVSNGNLIIGTAGKGIDFSAATHAAGMTSELLNDYEEGTWTPTDGSGAGLSFTGTSGNCFYTKVGNLVTCVFGLVYPTTADLSGAKLAGLPFTSKATSNSVSGGFITYTNSALSIAPLVGTNDTGVNLFLNTGNAAGNNQLSTFILRGIITYMV